MSNKAALIALALALALPAFADTPSTQNSVAVKTKTKPKSIMQQSNFSEGNTSATGTSLPGSGKVAPKAGKASIGAIGVSKNRCKQPNPPHDCVRPRPPH